MTTPVPYETLPHPPRNHPPIAWTIAGSDSGGGAGIQADLKTMQDLGVHGCSVITALTAQNSLGVQQVALTAPEMVRAQLRSLQEDLPPAAVKIGMLGAAETIRCVADFLRPRTVFVVCDPVMSASQGGSLLEADAAKALREDLLPRVDLLTPNRPEAEALTGRCVRSPPEVEAAARDLMELGVRSVLLKGGHAGGTLCQDYWFDGTTGVWITSPRWPVVHTHGGGCTLSAAIAAGLARGLAVLDAITLAKAYLNHGVRSARPLGQGPGPVAHLGWPDDPLDLPWITAQADDAAKRLAFPALDPGWGLYPVVDRASWVERLLALGVDLIQLRAKDLHGAALEQEVQRAVEAGRRAGARVFINDEWALALKYQAYGVHLGQEDLPRADLAALARGGLRLGLSTYGYAEMARANAVIPSYVAIGTIFTSPSKDVPTQPLGVDTLARMRKLSALPVVAIGGISLERAPAVRAAGADGIAVISDLTRAPDLAARVRQWRALWP